ncbi:hypothetical protein ACFLTZ_06295 [Chloroflexota bacterium]
MDVSPVGAGTIQLNQAAPASYTIDSTFDSGESVRLEAVPASGYHFDSWSGDLPGATNPTTIAMTCNKRVIANFSKIMHTITIGVKGSGSTSPVGGSYSYAEGTVVDIIATPHKGWLFERWTGDVTNPDSATTTVTLDADNNLVANFSRKAHSLTIHVSGSGSTNPVVGTHEYIEETLVNVTCKPDKGWQFVNWSGDVANPDSAAMTVAVDSDKILIANFHKSGPNWWLITGIAAGILTVALTIWLAFRARAT